MSCPNQPSLTSYHLIRYIVSHDSHPKQISLEEKGSSLARNRKNLQRQSVSGGIVDFYVCGRAVKSSSRKFTPTEMIKTLKEGLPVRELNALQAALAVPMESLAPMLGISKATLHRRRLGGRLVASESDRVVRFARLMGKATRVMESESSARLVDQSTIRLGGAVPLRYAETEIGAREVEDLLGRIEHGVYS